ncbi:hypothetical protein [Streptosporangium amethystogenes]|uniref:hypothetical protein n=1 Tax=Streptosporangium amethystogenes TaxID=2002 RepID=UPI0004C99FE9|nr:hypothetical protein [Streptosporangium amethystogenes]
MPNVENELRQAMIEETSALGVPPGLAHRVVQGADRGRRARTTAVALVAAAVLAAAVPGYLIVADRSGVASPTQAVDVDGVKVGYLPAGLGAPVLARADAGGLRGTGATWGSGDGLIRVTVYRDPAFHVGGAERVLGGIQGVPETLPGFLVAKVRGRGAFTRAEGDDLVWEERAGLVLRVTVGVRHRDDLRRIAGGLIPKDPTGGDFQGLRVTYVPPGLYLKDPFSVIDRTGWTELGWSGDDGASVRLLAVRGVSAADAETLLTWARTRQNLYTATPEKVRGKPGYRAAGGAGGASHTRMRLWLEKPGLGYLVEVNQGLATTLDRIVAGLVPAEPPSTSGDAVDHVTVAYLPPGLRRVAGETVRLGKGWSATAGRWSDGSRDVEVTVIRGVVLHSGQWVDEFLRGTKREPSRVGKWIKGIRTTDRDGRPGFFLETPELTIHAEVDPTLADRLNEIILGIRVPPLSYRPR